MQILRFIHLMSITVWVGMLTFFSFFAAPSIFKVLPRETAGDVVGHIFPKYWLIGYIASVLSLGSLVVLSISQKSFPALRIIILVVMTAVTFYSGLAIGGKARAIKAEMRAAEEPARKEALRDEFRKVHAISSTLNLIVIILGVVLVFFTSRTLRI